MPVSYRCGLRRRCGMCVGEEKGGLYPLESAWEASVDPGCSESQVMVCLANKNSKAKCLSLCTDQERNISTLACPYTAPHSVPRWPSELWFGTRRQGGSRGAQ